MFIYKIVGTIPAPVPVVFDYITKASNFPLWLKDVLLAGRASKELRLGSTMVQTIRILTPRKFTMHVTGYVKDRYFRIEAFKGFPLLPGYSFSFKPIKDNGAMITIYVMLSCRDEKDVQMLNYQFYQYGTSKFWALYFSLLEANIMKSIENKADADVSFASNKKSKKRIT